MERWERTDTYLRMDGVARPRYLRLDRSWIPAVFPSPGTGTNLQAVASDTHSAWAINCHNLIASNQSCLEVGREVRLAPTSLSLQPPEVIFSGSDQCATITRLSDPSPLLPVAYRRPAPTIGRGEGAALSSLVITFVLHAYIARPLNFSCNYLDRRLSID